MMNEETNGQGGLEGWITFEFDGEYARTGSGLLVGTITGMNAPLNTPVNCRITSMPFIAGISMSSNIRSYGTVAYEEATVVGSEVSSTLTYPCLRSMRSIRSS